MAAVEARELAHEIVEALVRAGEVAQHRDHERRGAAGPQEQGEMREIAARDDGVGDGVEAHVSPPACGEGRLARSASGVGVVGVERGSEASRASSMPEVPRLRERSGPSTPTPTPPPPGGGGGAPPPPPPR